MRILVIGAGGMIGRKLALRLAAEGRLGGTAIAALHLVDVVAPPVPEGLSGRITA
jgi:nucleoside-diphosphate-sugar epimerase